MRDKVSSPSRISRGAQLDRQESVRALLQAVTVVLALGGHAWAHPVETPNGADTVREVRENLASWKGKLVAFRVRILEVHFESKGQPILKVAVGAADAAETFWVASLVTHKFSVGNDVFMLGVMTRSSAAPASTNLSKLVEDKFMVLGICFLNMTENWGAGEQNSWKLCDEWYKRRMPDNPADP